MQEETEEIRHLIASLLDLTSYWDGWPSIEVYNEDGIVRGEMTEPFYEILKAFSEFVEE